MDFSSGGRRPEAARWLDIAERLLLARDLVGCKRFAERALDCDPLLSGVDQILAAADVLLASPSDPYTILNLSRTANPSEINRSYRRLALLLSPSPSPPFSDALRLVSDAFALLSDPPRKSLFDSSSSQTPNPKPPSNPRPPDSDLFWTACPSCCHVHEYPRAHLDRRLRCPHCRKPFVAAELSAPPPIIPGTDTYYCTWGFFPLGFPAGPIAPDWKPFYPMFPFPKPEEVELPPPAKEAEQQPQGRNKKKIARKKVGGSGLKKRAFVVEIGTKGELVSESKDGKEARGFNINEVVGGGLEGDEGQRGDEEMTAFHIDLDVDATEDVLGNLQNLPFLKDDFRMQ